MAYIVSTNYNPQCLSKGTTERKHTNLSPQEIETELTATTEEDDCFLARRLQITDKSKGFINLLGQLTVCDSISDEQFVTRFQDLTSSGDDHVICVIEDEQCGRIIATGSIFIEKKFIRNCGKVGHIEDVVVDSSVRGKRLGQKIIQFLMDHARAMGCYKVILDCSIENKGFYEKCGFNQKEIQMVSENAYLVMKVLLKVVSKLNMPEEKEVTKASSEIVAWGLGT